MHVEPPGPDGATEAVVESPPDEPIEGAHTTVRVEPSSLPRLRYGTSYSFRVLAVDLAGNSVPQVPPRRRRPITPDGPAVTTARTHLERLRSRYTERDLAGVAAARREAVIEHLRTPERAVVRLPDELRSGDARIDATLAGLVAQAAGEQPVETAAQRAFDDVAAASRVLAESRETLRVRPQLRIDPDEFALLTRNDDLLLPDELRRPARVDRHHSAPVPAVGAGPGAGARRPPRARHG